MVRYIYILYKIYIFYIFYILYKMTNLLELIQKKTSFTLCEYCLFFITRIEFDFDLNRIYFHKRTNKINF